VPVGVPERRADRPVVRRQPRLVHAVTAPPPGREAIPAPGPGDAGSHRSMCNAASECRFPRCRRAPFVQESIVRLDAIAANRNHPNRSNEGMPSVYVMPFFPATDGGFLRSN
ncbi:hypothetical protein, partial [Burkholderia pseudomultivorans]|uniref:hypothetical protein n=1 Tax=Burkholderia pseudomultivorans TaxID=1207504 RepID=UPI002870A923